ncbi:hypothetical protein [Burkholderia ubonensis]|uniref:hypothetical protein n=1 Tax=Burkholderia ubonensis TaxID=101571 RepID=UPI0007525285|nr:hypothetical protein [Burkholderia ubonensis]
MHKQLLAAAILAGAATGAFAQQQAASAPQAARPAVAAVAPEHEQRTVTREQFLNEAAQRFDAMDANKDGKVTPEERRAFRQAHFRDLSARHGEHAAHEGPHAQSAQSPKR